MYFYHTDFVNKYPETKYQTNLDSLKEVFNSWI